MVKTVQKSILLELPYLCEDEIDVSAKTECKKTQCDERNFSSALYNFSQSRSQLDSRGDVEDTPLKNAASANATRSDDFIIQSRQQLQNLNSNSDISSISGVSCTSWTSHLPWMRLLNRVYYRDERSSGITEDYTLHRDRNSEENLPIDQESCGSFMSTSAKIQRQNKIMNQKRKWRSVGGSALRSSPSSSTMLTADVADWDNKEWTPKDSAYGAACPICGFLPKNVRRGIEFTLIIFACFGFIYLIVHVSIIINNDHQGDNDDQQGYSDSDDFY